MTAWAKAILAAAAVLAVPALAPAQEPPGENGGAPSKEGFIFDAYVKLDPECVDAISKAQDWLASRQRQDGGWDTQNGRNNTGEISFAVLALMVNGGVPGEGKYAKNIGMGIQYVLNSQRESGLICGASNSRAPMYQHALSTLLLSEVYGMTENPRIRESLIKAVNLIVDSQDIAGGWRYQPKPEKGDISASVMQVMALRSSAEAGVYVPKETIDRAMKFVKACYNSKEKGFGYMNGSGPAGFARTAAGVVSMQTVGLYDDPLVKDAVRYISDHAFSDSKEWFWYGHYYASVALYHYGGEPWQAYYPKIKDKIISDWRQANWRFNGGTLDTAWGVLILGVPYRYLPIYQR